MRQHEIFNTNEPRHEISNNVACATSKGSDPPLHTLECSLSVKLLTEHHLEVLSLKGGCTGLSEYTLVKMPHWWKSNVAAQICNTRGGGGAISNYWNTHTLFIHLINILSKK